MSEATAILSMLHEPAGERNSALRLFRDRPVLWWTIERLQRAARIDSVAILCWEDQLAEVQAIAEEQEAYILAKGPRCPVPALDSITAARRWADGWRGGPLQTCEFDRGFYGPWVLELAKKLSSESIILVDPSAALVDPSLVDALIDHAAQDAESSLVFSAAAPGLSGTYLRLSLIEQLA